MRRYAVQLLLAVLLGECLPIYAAAELSVDLGADRERRQFANLPNGAACLGNLDCASGCCLVHYELAGVCVVRALPGQVCGLLSYVALRPPGFYNDPDYENSWKFKRINR